MRSAARGVALVVAAAASPLLAAPPDPATPSVAAVRVVEGGG